MENSASELTIILWTEWIVKVRFTQYDNFSSRIKLKNNVLILKPFNSEPRPCDVFVVIIGQQCHASHVGGNNIL